MSGLIIPENVIEHVEGRAIPKPEDDQNTDDMVPARYLIEITFRNMGDYLFGDERLKDRQPIKEHPLNDPRYDEGVIIFGGSNYGCGSSREHAPQATYRYGVGAVVAESFAEIFAGNSEKIGLVGVTVSGEDLTTLVNQVRKDPSTEFDIDLADKVIRYGNNAVKLDMPEGRRQAFLTGTWDAMAVLQHNETGIKGIESRLPYLAFK